MPTHPQIVIMGLKNIAGQFGICRQTLAKWIDKRDFPAMMLPDGTWATTALLIATWIAKQRKNKTAAAKLARRRQMGRINQSRRAAASVSAGICRPSDAGD
jgi:hypothetical protein